MKQICLNKFAHILFAVFLLMPCFSFAWGERGHHTICEVATWLVKDPDLSTFLKSRSHMMGHACNIPDIYWRDMGAISKSGDATHFMNPENLGYTLDTVPTDFKQILLEKQGKFSDTLKRNIDVAEDLGSSWWRYDQFYRRALANANLAKTLALQIQATPKDDPAIISYKSKFNAAIFSMLTNMGVMGHFMGDASQPYHNTTDYDGWGTQQGGIHGYYETKVVNELPLTLPQEVYEAALAVAATQSTGPSLAIDKIRNVGLTAIKDLARIRTLDVVLSPSKIVTNSDGSQTKIPAQRRSPAETMKDFKPLIVNEMALSALALAQTWDQIYNEAGRPSLNYYNSFTYPLQPDFVAPDYISRAPASQKAKFQIYLKKKSSHHND